MSTHVEASEIVFPGTNIRILQGTYGAANTDIPADTVLYDGTWPAGMADLGYTKGGISIILNRTIQDEYFDQDVDPVVQFTTQRETTMRSVLGQAQPDKIVKALGYGTVTELLPVSGTKGHTDLDIAGGLPGLVDIVPAFEIKLPDGEAMRCIFYRAQVRASVTLDFKKDTTVNVPYEVRGMRDTSGSNDRVLKIRRMVTALP